MSDAGYGARIAARSSAESGPGASQRSSFSRVRITGIRSCTPATRALGWQVTIAYVRRTPPEGPSQVSQSPANAKTGLSGRVK